MLNLNTTQIIDATVHKPFQVILKNTDKIAKKIVIMSYLTQEEEDEIDEGNAIILRRGSCTFHVSKNNIFAYGAIDYDDDDDLDIIADKTWFDTDSMFGVKVAANYDYKTNKMETKRWYDTTDPIAICRFKHGQLGKPERTIIFKI